MAFTVRAAFLVALIWPSGLASAEAAIRVGASASREVKGEFAQLVFSFPTESESLVTALTTIEELERRIVARLTEPCSGGVSATHLVRAQGAEPLSWRSSRAQLEHTFTLACRPESIRLRSAAAAAVDAALSLDPGLALIEASAALSDAGEDQLQRELFEEAVARAYAKAKAAADVLGSELSGVAEIEPAPLIFQGTSRSCLPSRPGSAQGNFRGGVSAGLRFLSSPGEFTATLKYSVAVSAAFALASE